MSTPIVVNAYEEHEFLPNRFDDERCWQLVVYRDDRHVYICGRPEKDGTVHITPPPDDPRGY